MRATINIDDDVFYAAKAVAKETPCSIGAILSDWARCGRQRMLSGNASPVDAALQPQMRNGIALLPKRGVIVTSEHVYCFLD